jgi:CheY-like chemotaxis protein
MQEVKSKLPLRVLLVDDYPDTTSTMAVLLGYWGYEVRTATDGPQALAIARDYRPDVVFLDTAMPGMDGPEVARRLRQEIGLANTLVVGISGYGSDTDRARAREAGCDAYLLKPVDPEMVRQLLTAREQGGAHDCTVMGSC